MAEQGLQALTVGQLTSAVGQSIATWRGEKVQLAPACLWLCPLHPAECSLPLPADRVPPALRAPSIGIANPPGQNPPCQSRARRWSKRAACSQLYSKESALQEPSVTQRRQGVPREPRGKSCTQLAAPRPAPRERF